MVREIDFTTEAYKNRAEEFIVAYHGEDDHINTPKLIEDLKDTLKSVERNYLCANEISYNVRAFAIKFSDDIKVFMCPVLQEKKDLKLIREQDPETGKEFMVPRYTNISLAFIDEEDMDKAIHVSDDAAVVVGQCMDCINGLHPSDYGLEIISEFDEAKPEEQQDVIMAYLDSLVAGRDKLAEELEADDTVNRYWEAYKYNIAKKNGEIETEEINPKNRKERRLLEKLFRKSRKKK